MTTRRWLTTPYSKALAVYAAAAAIVLTPLLQPGFVLTLDMVFTPHLRMPTHLNNSYLFYTLLHIVNYTLPAQIIQKLLLFGIFTAAGMSMHWLMRNMEDKPSTFGPYAAGLLYAINPFTYDRLMAGQYGILLGYALLPCFVLALLRCVRHPSRRAGFIAGVWAVVISIFSIHALGLLIIMTVMAGALLLVRMRSGLYARQLAVAGAWGIGLFVLLSSYWLVPLALGKGSTAVQLAQFSAQDSVAFATVGDSAVGKLSNVIRMQGFWAENQGQFLLPQDVIGPWGLLALALWIIVIAGFVQAWRHGQRLIVAFCGVLIVLGITLGSGVWSSAFGHLPFFGGFREPQKFVALVALGYSLGLGFGASELVRRLRAERSFGAAWVAAAATLLFPFMFTPTMVWGAHGQLKPRAYPAAWFTANQLLDKDHGNFQTLFLPWHLYMQYGFAGRIIASPAPAFFNKRVIVSDDPEFKGAAPAQPTATTQQLDKLLPNASSRNDLGTQLAKHNIKYVLLAHDNDFADYTYLHHQPRLTRIYTSNSIEVFRNDQWRQP